MPQYPANMENTDGSVRIEGQVEFTSTTNQPQIPNPITSGALPTASLSSGTAAQLSTARDVNALLAITNDATANAATCKVELSPDNSTFSTLITVSYASAVNNTGAIVYPVSVRVPQSWYVKVTVTHAAITSTTYW